MSFAHAYRPINKSPESTAGNSSTNLDAKLCAKKLRIVFWIVVMKIAITEARRDTRSIEGSRPLLLRRHSQIAALCRLDSASSAITQLTDGVIRYFTGRFCPGSS